LLVGEASGEAIPNFFNTNSSRQKYKFQQPAAMDKNITPLSKARKNSAYQGFLNSNIKRYSILNQQAPCSFSFIAVALVPMEGIQPYWQFEALGIVAISDRRS